MTDLNLGHKSNTSIIKLFDKTSTIGGREKIYDFFATPMDDINKITSRQFAIKYLASNPISHFFDKYVMADLEKYISLPEEPYSKFSILKMINVFSERVSLKRRRLNFFIKRSVRELADLVLLLMDFFEKISETGSHYRAFDTYKKSLIELATYIDVNELNILSSGKGSTRILMKYDYIFRNVARQKIRQLISITHELDALNTVGKILKSNDWAFPVFSNETNKDLLHVQDIFYPNLNRPVKNDLKVNADRHIVFLTGANMTGKSTLLRSVGIAIYLAHLGFPVPARSMFTRVYSGLLTTINLGDDIASGYSHFLNEVNRISKVAEGLVINNNMVLIFDELFKGTNYPDAHEATIELLKNIQGLSSSLFIISSHITEGIEKNSTLSSLSLQYMKTEIKNTEITFTYKLAQGIAKDRLGMWILNNKGVFQNLKKIK